LHKGTRLHLLAIEPWHAELTTPRDDGGAAYAQPPRQEPQAGVIVCLRMGFATQSDSPSGFVRDQQVAAQPVGFFLEVTVPVPFSGEGEYGSRRMEQKGVREFV
jgi:hypothetical protein